MVELKFASSEGWYLTFLSSFLCVLGCFVIFFDDIYMLVLPKSITNRYKFQLKENYGFLNGSLAFSSGCLLFTSLFKLLPEALEYFQDSERKKTHNGTIGREKKLHIYLIMSYIGGILLCFLFNAVLHMVTSESVVHCNHSGDEHHAHETRRASFHKHSHDGGNIDDLEQGNGGLEPISPVHSSNGDESTPLLNRSRSVVSRKTLIHYFSSPDENDIGECKGYTSAELCLFKNHNEGHELHFCEIPALAKSIDYHEDDLHPVCSPTSCHLESAVNVHGNADSTNDDHHRVSHSHSHSHSYSHGAADAPSKYEPDHHHHINTPLSRLLLIGVQTTLAISLHKLPEGFITFITSEANPQLGILIFLSLMIHNFTEGFLMCLPLYFLFSSSPNAFAKLKAVSVSALLGGLSQPMGAFLGYILLKSNHRGSDDSLDIHKLNFVLGIALAVTSGFLSVVGLSMYGSAVSFNGGMLNFILFWCIFGMGLIGVSSIITI